MFKCIEKKKSYEERYFDSLMQLNFSFLSTALFKLKVLRVIDVNLRNGCRRSCVNLNCVISFILTVCCIKACVKQ